MSFTNHALTTFARSDVDKIFIISGSRHPLDPGVLCKLIHSTLNDGPILFAVPVADGVRHLTVAPLGVGIGEGSSIPGAGSPVPGSLISGRHSKDWY